MNGYIPLKTALNQVPKSILEEGDKVQMLSWAYLFIREYFRHYAEEHLIGAAPIINHSAKLPNELKALYDVFYSSIEPPAEACEVVSEQLYTILSIASGDSYLQSNIEPMKYIGNDQKIMNHSLISLYCRDCYIGFSVDKQLSCLTTDKQDGWAIFFYSTLAKDNNGNHLIPDIPELNSAIASFIQYKYWEDKFSIKEEQAFQLSQHHFQRAMFHRDRARTREMIRRFSSDRMKTILYKRANIQLATSPMVTGNYKNR